MSEGRRSKRLSEKNPIDYSDTKRISSPNRYSALDQEEEVEESIVFYPDTEEENDNNDDNDDDNDDDDWIITGTMANEPKTNEIDLGLTKKELAQNDRATLLDILRQGPREQDWDYMPT